MKAYLFVAVAFVVVHALFTFVFDLPLWPIAGTVVVLSAIGTPFYVIERRSRKAGG